MAGPSSRAARQLVEHIYQHSASLASSSSPRWMLDSSSAVSGWRYGRRPYSEVAATTQRSAPADNGLDLGAHDTGAQAPSDMSVVTDFASAKSSTVSASSDSSATAGTLLDTELKPPKKGKRANRRNKKVEERLARLGRLVQSIKSADHSYQLSEPAPPPESEAVESRPTHFRQLLDSSTAPSTPQEEAQPSLENLLTYKPPYDPKLESPKYSRQYKRLYDKIDGAFVKRQIGILFNELVDHEKRVQTEQERLNKEAEEQASASGSGIIDPYTLPSTPASSSTGRARDPRASSHVLTRSKSFALDRVNTTKQTKKHIIERLLDVWGWVRPEVVEREKKMREKENQMATRDIPLSNAEVWLLFKQDPSFYSELTIRRSTSIKIVKEPKLCLHVASKMKNLPLIEQMISKRCQTITSELYTPPFPSTLSELHPVISDMSGAYLESAGANHIRLHYVDKTARDEAIRLLLEAGHRLVTEPKSHDVLAVYRKDASWALGLPHNMALYPHTPYFLTSADASWHFRGKAMFRLRRAGSWFGSVGSVGITNAEEVEALDVEHLNNNNSSTGSNAPTFASLLESVQHDQHNSTTDIEFGSLVFGEPVQQSGLSSLVPPQWFNGTLDTVAERCRTSSGPLFIPLRIVYRSKQHQSTLIVTIKMRSGDSDLIDPVFRPESVRTTPIQTQEDIEATWGTQAWTACMLPDHLHDLRISKSARQSVGVDQIPSEITNSILHASEGPTAVTWQGEDLTMESDVRVERIAEPLGDGLTLVMETCIDPKNENVETRAFIRATSKPDRQALLAKITSALRTSVTPSETRMT